MPEGTHEGKRRSGSWPNTKAPEQTPGRKIRKARERLEARIKAYEEIKISKEAFRKPGSLKCK